LKNIVNIDKFFSSGAKSPEPTTQDTSATTFAKKKKAPTSPPSLATKNKHVKKSQRKTKLSQMHASDEQDMENEIAADVSDSQATAAA
jgi:hypothetical protein